MLPPSLFLFLFSPFYFYFFGLIGSFYLYLICPLGIFCFVLFWDLLFCPLWDLFLTLGAALYILQEVYKIFHTLQRYSHKEDITIMVQMYASARIAGYAMILARHVAIRERPN